MFTAQEYLMLFGEKSISSKEGTAELPGMAAGMMVMPYTSQPWELRTGLTGSNDSLIEFTPILLNSLGLGAGC